MRQVWTTRTGPPEVLEMREAPDPSPLPGEARIRVKASGINFADIMTRLGIYPDAPRLPAVVGYEVCGVVDALGAGVTSVKEGDAVIGICRFGGYADTVCIPVEHVFPLPNGMSFSQGAVVPVSYLTVYQMLFVMGGVKKGDKVLVHSAAGGIGFAAIDLCNIAGAEIIGTASASKHAILRDRGVRHVIDYRTQDVETEVLRITGGKGVQIVLDPIGGESWATSLRCLAPTGRLIAFGFSSAATGKAPSRLAALGNLLRVPWLKINPLTLISGNKGVLGVNLGHLWHCDDMIRDWSEQIFRWYAEGKIHPTVGKEFPLARAAEAHHYIQDRKNIGKVVLVPDR